ncbi:MAG: MarR family transcriptional regulator [Coriobacteriia bacterium]|nr:MarR family transcriptional regulator [Coriobacteriia bacterium]
MNDFEAQLNHMLVETFNTILKYEEVSLNSILDVPVTIAEAHMIEAVGAHENNKATVSAVASQLKVSMPTATVALKKLESKGFIAKVPCMEDGRRAIVRLTDAGMRINRAHQQFHKRMVRNISRQLDGAEKGALLIALTKLSDFFKEKIDA